ncbi:MAG: hypothetical protein VX974_12240, partial [Pseudomonadota bacterium]|nr:hypothetical protein [Pseudomonadota bacterium]
FSVFRNTDASEKPFAALSKQSIKFNTLCPDGVKFPAPYRIPNIDFYLSLCKRPRKKTFQPIDDQTDVLSLFFKTHEVVNGLNHLKKLRFLQCRNTVQPPHFETLSNHLCRHTPDVCSAPAGRMVWHDDLDGNLDRHHTQPQVVGQEKCQRYTLKENPHRDRLRQSMHRLGGNVAHETGMRVSHDKGLLPAASNPSTKMYASASRWNFAS